MESRLIETIKDKVTAKLEELAEDAERAAEEAKEAIEQARADLQESVDSISQTLSQWTEDGPSDASRVLNDLMDALHRELELNRSKDDRRHFGDQLQEAVSRLERYQREFQSLNEQIHEARNQAEREMEAVPGFLRGAVLDLAERLVRHTDTLRAPFKAAENNYLTARADLLFTMKQMAPEGNLQDVLGKMHYQAQQLVWTEANNTALDDVLEEVRDFALQSVAAIVEFFLDMLRDGINFAAFMLETTVDAVKDATQGVLRFANGVLTDLLSAFDVTYIFVKSTLGGQQVFTFDATVKGTIDGKPFEFQIHISFADFWAMIEALFEK